MPRLIYITILFITFSSASFAQDINSYTGRVIVSAKVIQSIELVTINTMTFSNAQPGQLEIIVNPVTDANAGYMIANGTVTSDKNSVKKIEVQIMAESGSAYTVGRNSEDFYPRSVWKRIFVPNNINLPY